MVINTVNLNSIVNNVKPVNGSNGHIVFGNIVNLHAVGALTAGGGKVAHTFRPWEVQSIDSIDLMDSCLGSVRYQVRGGEIMRILPRVNDKINGEWATDKGRYAPLDGVKSQEVRNSMIKDSKNSNWETISIETVFEEIKKIKGKVRVVYGGTTDCESINARANWCKDNNISLESISPINNSKSKVNIYDSTSDESFVPSGDKMNNGLLIGCDPRRQSPLLNVQLRERYLEGTEFYRIGGSLDLTYPVRHIGLGIKSLERFKSENNKVDFALVGADLYRRNDIDEVLGQVSEVAGSNKIRICTTRSNETYIIGHQESKSLNLTDSYEAQLLVNITSIEVDAAGYNISEITSKAKTNIVITAKGSDWMKQANIIIPVLNCLETESTYVSMFGGSRTSQVIVKSNDKVFSIEGLFKNLPSIQGSTISEDVVNKVSEVKDVPLVNSMVDYHLEGHTFAESSATMGRCSGVFRSYQTNFK